MLTKLQKGPRQRVLSCLCSEAVSIPRKGEYQEYMDEALAASTTFIYHADFSTPD